MHIEPVVSCAAHAPAATPGIGADSRAGQAQDFDGGDREMDATLRLLKACVEAMGLLQAKVVDLDQRFSAQPDVLGAVRAEIVALRESATTRQATHVARPQADDPDALAAVCADVAMLRDALVEAGQRLSDAEARAGRLEGSLAEQARRHADDIASAVTEAAQWRMRAETDGMAFDQLGARLASLEQGLSVKLNEAQQSVADRDAENARLQSETRVVETASDRLRARLTSMDATIADQRARIQSLQNKLATATYAMRADHLARTMDASQPTAAFDILDLGTPAGRVSAA